MALMLAVPYAAAQGFDRIVVFGTSLSDPGNAFALRGGKSKPPDFGLDPFLIPDAPYAKGGHHFSNGATWIEQYARGVRLAKSVGPALKDPKPKATNYAVGAARAYDDEENFNLPQQVAAFFEEFGGAAPSSALYVIEMGGNDLRDALVAGPSEAGVVLGKALLSIGDRIVDLYFAGARNFLVWNAPNIGLTPAIKRAGPAAVGGAAFLTQEFNFQLGVGLQSLRMALPGISIVQLDVAALLTNIVEHPADFGLTNVTDACVMPNVPPFHCKNPDDYLFWDGIHPTKEAHGIIAQEAARLLSH